jgi:hypothetical protein
MYHSAARAATKSRFFVRRGGLRMTCHPERSEGSAFLRATRRSSELVPQVPRLVVGWLTRYDLPQSEADPIALRPSLKYQATSSLTSLQGFSPVPEALRFWGTRRQGKLPHRP